MAVIETPEDWWELWETSRCYIIAIAEERLAIGLEEVPIDGSTSLGFDINTWTVDRDWKPLVDFLQKLWETAPDKRIIHSWEGWADLCDLCSERWVFETRDPVNKYLDVTKGG